MSDNELAIYTHYAQHSTCKLSFTDRCTVVDVGWQPISIDSLLEVDNHNCCAEFQLIIVY